jgi:NlpC/P60 family putative phage cell wall peptidase
MTLTRSQIVGETRDWIGTPYQHQASLKGVGCDCLGLVRGVWRAVIGEEPERAPPYAPGWAEAASGEPLADARRPRGISSRSSATRFARATCCCSAGARICRPSMRRSSHLAGRIGRT